MKTETEKGMTLVETQTETRPVSGRVTGSTELSKLIQQYGCGPVQFTGTNDALYERHLVFDNVMDAAAIGDRERFEAMAAECLRKPFCSDMRCPMHYYQSSAI